MSDDLAELPVLVDKGHVDYFVADDATAEANAHLGDKLYAEPPAPRTWAEVRAQFTRQLAAEDEK